MGLDVPLIYRRFISPQIIDYGVMLLRDLANEPLKLPEPSPLSTTVRLRTIESVNSERLQSQ